MLGIALLGAAALNFSARGTLIYWIICYLKRTKSYKVLQSIREQWSGFCMEKFISMASNRLKCIFYADSMAEIGDFVSCDLKTKIKRKKLTVKLRFTRPKESIMSMDFYRDWYIGEIKVIK